MKPPKQSRSFDGYLFILMILSVVCLSPIGEKIATIGALIIIGIPLTLIIAVIPAITLFLLVARISYSFLYNRNVNVNWFTSAIASLALLAIPPLLINGYFDYKATNLMAGDSNNIDPSTKISTLAVIYPMSYYRGGVCDDFCQRALLNNQVQRMVMARVKSPMENVDLNITGVAYWFEKRDVCPKIELKDGINNLEMKRGQKQRYRRKPSELIRLRATSGICFITGEAKINEADAVLILGNIKRSQKSTPIGLNPFIDTISASRLSFDLRENGKLERKYQATMITTNALFPVLLPGLFESRRLQLNTGFLRKPTYLGGARKYHSTPPLTKFVQDVLQFNVELSDQEGDERALNVVRAALKRTDDLTVSELAVIRDIFKNVPRRTKLSEEKTLLMLDILEDHRIPIPSNTSSIVRNLPDSNSEITDRMAAILFERLRSFTPDRTQSHPNRQYASLGALGKAIAALPDGSVEPYFSELDALAKKKIQRIYAYVALKRLSDFKGKGIPPLLHLIDDADAYRKTNGKTKNLLANSWQHPYLAGIQGLCRLARTGFKDDTIVSKLYERIDDKRINMRGSYAKSAVATLIGFGADPEEIWQHFEALNSKYLKPNRKRFDHIVSRSKNKLDCSY